MTNKLTKWLTRPWVSLIVLLLPIGLYILRFNSYKISKDPADWGVFGDYMGGIYSALIGLLLFYISQQLERNREKEKKKQHAIEEISEQINTFKKSRNKSRSVEKLINIVLKNRLYFEESFFEKMSCLTDNYQRYVNKEEEINQNLEDEVLRKIKRMYE